MTELAYAYKFYKAATFIHAYLYMFEFFNTDS